MEKEDMILQMINKIDKNNREDHQIIFDKIDKIKKGNGLTVKEWSILAGMIATICTTVVGIVEIIFK